MTLILQKKVLGMEKEPHPNILKMLSPETWKRLTDIWANISYVNCWHICEHKSAFLWSVYAAAGDGIAIRTTLGKLKASLAAEARHLYMGQVKYINFEDEAISVRNLITPLYIKRKSFEAERELRVCFMTNPPLSGSVEEAVKFPDGCYVRVELGELIGTVFVSPAAPQWYFDAVVAVAGALSLGLPLERSSLRGPAIF